MVRCWFCPSTQVLWSESISACTVPKCLQKLQCLYLIWIPHGWPKPARRIWQASENTAAASTNDDATTMAEDHLLLLVFFFLPLLSMTRSIQKPCFTSIVAGKHATLKALKACKDNSKLSDREGKTWHDQYNYLQTLYIYICTEDIRRSLPRITPAVASAMKGLERFWAPKTGTSWYFHTVACLGSTLYHFCLDRRTWSGRAVWGCKWGPWIASTIMCRDICSAMQKVRDVNKLEASI